jgi:hypothetical protein
MSRMSQRIRLSIGVWLPVVLALVGDFARRW